MFGHHVILVALANINVSHQNESNQYGLKKNSIFANPSKSTTRDPKICLISVPCVHTHQQHWNLLDAHKNMVLFFCAKSKDYPCHSKKQNTHVCSFKWTKSFNILLGLETPLVNATAVSLIQKMLPPHAWLKVPAAHSGYIPHLNFQHGEIS